MRLRWLVPVMLFAAVVAAPVAQAHGGGPQIQTIATGLDSPRHLAFGPWGDLYVAEAGRGGDGPCFAAAEGPACMGDSGAVTKIDRWGHQTRIADHLASFANTPGNVNAIGPHGITVVGGQVFVTNGGPTEPLDPSGARIVPLPRSRPRTPRRTCSAGCCGSATTARRRRSPTSGRSSATSTRTRPSATHTSTPTRSTSCSTAALRGRRRGRQRDRRRAPVGERVESRRVRQSPRRPQPARRPADLDAGGADSRSSWAPTASTT